MGKSETRPYTILLPAALLAGTQIPQEMPVVDTVIVSILPDDGDAVGACRQDVFQACSWRIGDRGVENFRIGF